MPAKLATKRSMPNPRLNMATVANRDDSEVDLERQISDDFRSAQPLSRIGESLREASPAKKVNFVERSPAEDFSAPLRHIEVNNPSLNRLRGFASNYIRTTKYTLLSFLPLGIAYQFYRFSNCYFLLVVILSCIDIISPVSAITAINPFVFVMAVSLIREAVEDFARYKSDKA